MRRWPPNAIHAADVSGKTLHNDAMMKLVNAFIIVLFVTAFGALGWEIWVIYRGP